jgi:hypothetical protein
MNAAIHNPLLVDKEIVGSLHFPSEEILTTTESKQKREYELVRAASLGTDKVKIKILFEDSEGLKQVETTVWAVTKERIVLKHGATIPIMRIHEIKI